MVDARRARETVRPQPVKTSRLAGVLATLLAVSLAANAALAWRMLRPPVIDAKPAGPPRELVPYAALGSYVAENNHIADLKWSEAQITAFLAGLRASYEGRGYPFDDDARQLRSQINALVQTALDRERPDPVEDYLRTLREQENVSRTASGLHFRITLEGEGEPPKPTDTVVVSYAASTPEGEKIDALINSRVRVSVTDLLPGLAEGVQLLKPGGKALVYLPPQLSFGKGPWPEKVPPGMPLAFFLELHEVVGPQSNP
jgi:FKBP-type peptidyl-prolyl cis-trans isomerase FkpA